MQRTHYNTNFKQHTFPITLICDNITNALNIGSLFRIADAFGVKELIFCGEHIALGGKITKTSRATEKVVKHRVNTSTVNVVSELKASGHYIVSLEITTNSKPIHEFNFPKSQAIVLVVGDENFGVSDAILKLSNAIIHIDMFGQNSSMNVVQAANIALFEITKQLM